MYLSGVWLPITDKLTNKDLTDRGLFVLQLTASLGVGGGGLAGNPVRPSETCVFHLSVQPSLEYRSSFSWLSLYGYGMAYCPSRHSVQILEGKRRNGEGRGSCQPSLSFRKPHSYLLYSVISSHSSWGRTVSNRRVGRWNFYLGTFWLQTKSEFYGKEK